MPAGGVIRGRVFFSHVMVQQSMREYSVVGIEEQREQVAVFLSECKMRCQRNSGVELVQARCSAVEKRKQGVMSYGEQTV